MLPSDPLPRPSDPTPTALVAVLLALAVAAPATVGARAAPPVLDARADTLRVAGGVPLHYELSGSGPPLVLIHGWTHDGRVWDLQVPALERRYTVLRYDRRGWGRSGGNPDVSRDPHDLDSLMAALDLRDAHVVGHSQGAGAALRFTLAHPGRVRSLVLYGARAPSGFDVPLTGEDALPDLPAFVREHGLDSLGAVLFERLGRGFDPGDPGLAIARRLWTDNARKAFEDPDPPSGATPRPSIDRLRDVQVPVLVLTGELELEPFRIAGDALAYVLPDARRVEIPGGGHAVHLQEPERWTAEVVRFLRETEGAR